jgi:8-amino-7-oxononanoate synthase
VATESVFAAEGDSPDLVQLAKLKRQYLFHWVVDEAHAIGWYGPEGAGLIQAAGVGNEVDVLIGTLGKTLASGGAYTLFRNRDVCDFVMNEVGEFMYSTALPPANAAAAATALTRVRELAPQQKSWQETSRYFRAWLQAEGWDTPSGDSPIVPVHFADANAAQSLSAALREAGVFASALRSSAAPASPAQLRFCLKRTFSDHDAVRVLACMAEWKAAAPAL